MTKEQVIKIIAEGTSQKIKFAVADFDGILRGKVIHREKFLEVVNSSISFCDVIFGWDMADECYDNVEFTGWHTGYPDGNFIIDLSTYRTIPWEGNMPFFLGYMVPKQLDGVNCPRGVLKNVVDKASEMGFKAIFSAEYEWFNFSETSHSLKEKSFIDPKTITPGMFGYSMLKPAQFSDFYNNLFDQLASFDIQLEGMHTETGPGVYEAAIRHDDVLNAADKAVLFKTAVKQIAYSHGIMASFMAKWNSKLPGCGAHLHQSIWDSLGNKNLFYDANQPNNMSNLMRQYIAGQLYCLPFILPMYAPTINSYKRLVEGAWAPTKATWGIDNRTVAVRVIPASEKATRLEMRVPGADINPYLAMAASLASGLYGISNKLELSDLPIVGNGYGKTGHAQLPGNLQQAALAMQTSDIAAELFGKSFVDHFTATRLWEWKKFSNSVTNWEMERYFEII